MLMNPSEAKEEFTYIRTSALNEASMKCEDEFSADGGDIC